MGTRQHKLRCLDCYEKYKESSEYNSFEVFEESSFWIDMEHMGKDELLNHIEDTSCPECGSDNWQLTDESEI